MDQRIPAVLTSELEQYLSSINQRLPEFLCAFYVVGSIALDEFNPHYSDIDFVALLNHPATAPEISILHQIHAEIERQYPRWKLSGVYLLENALGKNGGEVKDSIAYHDGKLRVDTNFELNPVTWWILKHHGIPMLGPDPRDLAIAVDAATLVSWTHANMNTYWKNWTRRPIRLTTLLTDWGIQWTVLGISRQLYTIREKNVITKQRAGAYVISVLSPQWHPLVKEAIRIRTKSTDSLYRSRITRAVEVRNFLNCVIQISNDYFQDVQS